MINRLRQWFKTKASYEKSLMRIEKLYVESKSRIDIIRSSHGVQLKDALYVRDRSEAYDEHDIRREVYKQIYWDIERQGISSNTKLRTSLGEAQEENKNLQQQIISLTADGITLKNELDELKREI